jgi:hypothetical protein
MLISLPIALAAAIVVLTWLYTLDQYHALPERVPLHVGPGGNVDGWGPRSMIWLLPAVQLLCAALFFWAGHELAIGATGTHGSVRGLAFFAPCILAILGRAQALLISAAKSHEQRVPMGGFWLFFAVMLGAGMLSVLFL